MTKTFTMTGRNWSEFITENASDPAAQDAITTVKETLSAYRATVAQQYSHMAPRNFDTEIDRQVGCKTFIIALPIPA